MTGFSLELSDKKVDKILEKSDFKVDEIFYSPIQAWFTLWGLLLAISIPVTINILYVYFSNWSIQNGLILIILYFLICYVLIAFFNRSFALTDKELLVVNSHFPFKKLHIIELEDVTEIDISSDWKMKPLTIFGVLYSNYIEIKTLTTQRKFYCLFLDVDCYDENWTEKNLDDLFKSLKQRNVNVEMRL